MILGQIAINIGQRAFIGKISMNEKHNDNYYETTEESIRNINKFIEDLIKLNVRFKYYLNLYFNFLFIHKDFIHIIIIVESSYKTNYNTKICFKL